LSAIFFTLQGRPSAGRGKPEREDVRVPWRGGRFRGEGGRGKGWLPNIFLPKRNDSKGGGSRGGSPYLVCKGGGKILYERGRRDFSFQTITISLGGSCEKEKGAEGRASVWVAEDEYLGGENLRTSKGGERRAKAVRERGQERGVKGEKASAFRLY